MRHILNFSLFEAQSEGGPSNEIVFDWLEYDAKVGDPIQASIPKTLTTTELQNYIAENSSVLPKIEKAGIYVAHVKTPEGFNRMVVTSFSPLLVDFSQFNKNFEKVNELKGVKADSDFSILSKGASLIGSRFS